MSSDLTYTGATHEEAVQAMIDDLPEGVADCGARGYLHKAALNPASLAGLAARGPAGGAP